MLLTQEDIRNYYPEYTEEGRLIVRTSTGGGAFPLSGAAVTVYVYLPDGTPKLYRVLFTDENGETAPISLPAPPRNASESPAPAGAPRPYAAYRVVAQAKGYAPVTSDTVPVFSGITSRQSFRMLPLPDQAGTLTPEKEEEETPPAQTGPDQVSAASGASQMQSAAQTQEPEQMQPPAQAQAPAETPPADEQAQASAAVPAED